MATTTTTRPPCPICGTPLRRWGRGITARQRRWICPADRAETVTDERGHLKRVPNPVHAFPQRIWDEDELAEVAAG